MAKNNMSQNKTNSNNPCKRIRDAIVRSPPFRVIRWRPLPPNHEPSTKHTFQTKPTSPHNLKINGNTGTSSGLIPISFDYSNPASNDQSNKITPTSKPMQGRQLQENTEMGNPVKARIGTKVTSKASTGEAAEEARADINHTFNEYIERARIKIRTVSNSASGRMGNSASDGRKIEKKESARDQFSEFIRRARMKIRTTSRIGSGKTISFKKE